MNYKTKSDEKGRYQVPGAEEQWRTVRLGEVADLVAGFPFKSDQYVQDKDAPRLLRGDNVGQGWLRWDGVKRWPQNALKEVSDYWLREGDIVLAMDRPWIDAGLKYASVGHQDLPSLLVQRVARLRETDRLDILFLKYVIASKAFTDFVLAVQTGTAVPHISGDQIKSYEFLLPPIHEQHQIACILGRLDEKIELNREMNATLEALSQAIFKRWFVDFEFLNEEGKPYKSSGGEMVESEKGAIPKEWRVAELDRFGKIICGKTPPKADKEFFGGDVPFIKIPDMHHQLFIIDTEDALSDKGRRYQANKSIPPNSICVSCIATVGLVSITTRESQTNQQINCVVPHEEFFMPYLFYTMKSLKKELEDLGSGGSATLNVNTNVFSRIRLIAPKADVIKEFCKITVPLLTKIRANLFENRTLSQIRDSLLPKLMSGKIRMPVREENARAQ